MPATLNLQFTPVEITDDSLMTSAMTPDVAPNAEFADLLRLRVDTAQELSTSSGQMLPQGGSDLPLQALPVELEAPDAPELSVLPQASTLSALSQAEPALTPSLEGLATEQPLPASLAADAALVVPATAAPAINTPGSLMPAASSRDISPLAESRPLPAIQQSLPRAVTPAQIQETLTSLSGKLELNAPALREPPLPIQAQPVAAAVVDKSMPIVELPRRVEASPLPVINVEEISDVFKARPTVIQPVQVLNAQPNPQQAVVLTAPPTAVGTDTGFAAAVQQASDLVSVPVRNAAWAEQIGERVLMMAGKQMTSAEIRLTPAELGPLRVQVSVDDGAANVTFQAQHAVTREAIEQALPRLRELLAENGLSLGEASVGEQGVAEGKRDEHSDSPHAASGDAFDDDDAVESLEARRVVASDSLVDTFV